MNIIDPKWIKADHERQVAALVVTLQAFELISNEQGVAAAKARATLWGDGGRGSRTLVRFRSMISVQPLSLLDR